MTSSTCRSKPPLLKAAQGAGASHGRWPEHAALSGGERLLALVRRDAEGDGRAAQDSGRRYSGEDGVIRLVVIGRAKARSGIHVSRTERIGCMGPGSRCADRDDTKHSRGMTESIDVHPRPHRLDRHGQVDHGADFFARGRRAGARLRCGGAPALRRRGGRRRSRLRFPASRSTAGSTARSSPRSSSAIRTRSSRLEAIVHPLVRAVSERFIAEQRRAARASSCSTFRCCSRPAARSGSTPSWWSRRRRTCSARACSTRAGMTAERLDALLARQMSDAEKRARAHFVVDSSRSFDSARAQVHGILRAVAALPGRRIG